MESSFTEQDEYESGPDSPSPPKRSKREAKKRVVSIPIKELVEGGGGGGSSSRVMKGEISSPPADSWAWRKYGQKPIKGSPYPRGYYRCSSSKGCPARKQVERSRLDPTTLVVTYSGDHTHTHPSSRSHHHPKPAAAVPDTPPTSPPTPDPEPEPDSYASFAGEPLILSTAEEEFSWLGEMETTPCAMFAGRGGQLDFGVSSPEDVFLPMREEDESLFADLGELPECTAVFRHHRGVGTEVRIC